MKTNDLGLSIKSCAEKFGKSRQGYYDRFRVEEKRKAKTLKVLPAVNRQRKLMPSIGVRKLKHMIKKYEDLTVGRDWLFTFLRERNMLVKRPRKRVITTQSDHPYNRYRDLVKDLKVEEAEQLLVADITYIRLSYGFTYLFLVTDGYSKRILGFYLSEDLSSFSCRKALDKALSNMQYDRKPIHHSDRGSQYCCSEYVTELQLNKLSISMTQSGDPRDNAIAERVNGILKTELGLDRTFNDFNEANSAVYIAITIYNGLRPHLSCNYLTPNEAHEQRYGLVKAWKNYRRKKYSANPQILDGKAYL